MTFAPFEYAPCVLSGKHRFPPDPKYPLSVYRLHGVTDNPHIVNGETLPIGSVYCIQPGNSPEVFYPKRDHSPCIDFSVTPCRLEGEDRWRRLADGEPDQPGAQEVWGVELPLLLPESLSTWILPRLKLIVSLWWRGSREHFTANMRLIEILEHITDVLLEHQSASISPEFGWFHAIDRAVQERIVSVKDVSDLAAIAGMSRSHFSQRFHEDIGIPPGEWLRNRRLHAAEELLRVTDLNIRQIAERVGFPHPSSLNHSWRKKYQCSPTEWRNRRLGR